MNSSGYPGPDMIEAPDPLTWDQIADKPRLTVTPAQIAEWKLDPQPLLNKVFVNPAADTDGGGLPELFRVLCFLVTPKKEDRLYYVQGVDDDQAYASSDKFFWEDLPGLEYVVVG